MPNQHILCPLLAGVPRWTMAAVCARNTPETMPLERSAAFIRVNITLRRCKSYMRQQLKVYLDHHRRIDLFAGRGIYSLLAM
ncbi:MAG: hypothetical protein H0T87_12950 [Gammaproteobacteria bacterium]|nr:hypothetical protein [Gammaproteobacteria bacterium]